MSVATGQRAVNPRLGSYFAVYAAAYAAIVVLALMAEQMAVPIGLLNWAMLAAPVAGYALIGIAGYTDAPLDFFAAGRRVPAVYSGFTLAFSAFGGTGLVAITGTLFLVGFDALCLVIGGLAGFVVMGILLAPFFRKFGAYTIPSYLGRRFESPALRVIAAFILVLPLMLMLVAEIKTAAFAGAFATAAPTAQIVALVAVALVVSLWPGGMRGLTWSNVAQTISALFALIIPVAIVAVILTNLPFPQMSYGPAMRTMARQEAAQGVPLLIAQGLAFDLPGDGISSISKRFATSFSVVGRGGFVAAMLTIMMGIAAAPWLLPRIATTPGVYHARKSLGWATVLFGFIMLTATAIAVFTRGMLLDSTMGGQIPEWIRVLAVRGYADVDAKVAASLVESARGVLASVGIMRDVTLYALPMAAGLPGVFVAFAVAGVVAASLAGASAAAMALASQCSEDIVYGMRTEPPPDAPRLGTARLCILLVIATGGVLAASLPGDPFDMLLVSLALTGSSLFPVLVLSVWWKRINAFGAMAGLVSGFGVALIAVAAGHFEWVAFDPALAGMFGIPAALIATVATSYATPRPGRHMLELVRDIRVPGGEILYDREMRLLRLKKRQRLSNPV